MKRCAGGREGRREGKREDLPCPRPGAGVQEGGCKGVKGRSQISAAWNPNLHTGNTRKEKKTVLPLALLEERELQQTDREPERIISSISSLWRSRCVASHFALLPRSTLCWSADWELQTAVNTWAVSASASPLFCPDTTKARAVTPGIFRTAEADGR